MEPDTYLYNDVEFILKEETREPRQYFSILRAIALGKHKLGEIVNETGIEKTSLHKYLYYLEELQIIQKRFPVTEKNIEKSRQGLYYLADNYFSFWFDMVFLYRSELVLGNKRPALARFDQAFVHQVAAAYEQIGGEILRRFQDELFPFSRVGKWWHKNQEIDIVALGDREEDILFAEAKWSSKKVGVDIFQALKERSKSVQGNFRRRHYALLSRSGFTAAMERLAREENVLLIHGETKV
ncbi:MAG: ATP-binding protein [candidate division KSB1 bacterium]|nr:ATP-binding protein [candidate division KSB1 bacterium]MDZ7365136.1 ATP-binding protein [candidate division KSB1 bacterium]MDZ7404346.1 ATP-binding protein [candidate division KSB1 bacterium]